VAKQPRGASRQFSLFRFLDGSLARLACIALNPMVMLLHALSKGGRARPRRILVIKFFGLGSILRGWPLFSAIRRSHPGAQLDVLTFRSNAELARRLEVFDRILDVDSSSGSALISSMFRRIGEICAGRYDIVIDMEFFSNFAAFLAALTRAPLRVGYYLRRSFRESILNRIVPYNPARHITEVYAALGRSIGVLARKDDGRSLRALPGDRVRLEALLARMGVSSGERLVVLNTASSGLCDERRWPPGRFAWLGDRFLSRGRERVLFIGAPSERGMVEEERGHCRVPGSLSLAGRTDLGMLIALLERSALVVTNDSGPAHLADAIGTPVIVLFGPESPAHYGPQGARSAAFHAGLYCSPCLNAANTKIAPCAGNNVCMSLVPKEDVLEAALEVLEGREIPRSRLETWRGYEGRWSHDDWKSVGRADR
jgi:ADP-heptose:LPS heptosyltransferase